MDILETHCLELGRVQNLVCKENPASKGSIINSHARTGMIRTVLGQSGGMITLPKTFPIRLHIRNSL